ncbi:MAG: hypothetical protein AAGF48_14075 [Pseudomonadota bacterium]
MWYETEARAAARSLIRLPLHSSALLTRFGEVLRERRMQLELEQAIARMDDHLLRDIGLGPEDRPPVQITPCLRS